MSFKTKKSLGQHFLTDKNIIFKIVSAINAHVDDRIIEIGAGTGALTRYLLEAFGSIHAVEIDSRAVEELKQFEGLTIHQNDILKVNWDELLSPEKDNYVVGNLPYYITSPIIFALFDNRKNIKEAILMMQKEVAQRLVAHPNSKDYGILSVQTQLFCSPELLFDVSPNSFNPPPKVTSSVIRLRFDKPELPCSDTMLKTVVRTAFNQRRKKLSNALKPLLNDFIPKDFNFDKRAEDWPPQTYAKLAELLEQSAKLSG